MTRSKSHKYVFVQGSSGFAQLFLRLALGIGFLLPVMDRIGLLGVPGTAGVAWGDMKHFIEYTNTLIPFASHALAQVMAVLATFAEAIFGICLIFGIKTKLIALGAAILTLTFGVCMATYQGIGAPFNYPVFVFTGAAWVLSCLPHFSWSIDALLARKSP